MTDPHLRALVEAVLDDPEIAPRYRKAPAAKQIHHAWLGGLLEHVLSLCQLCRWSPPATIGVDLNLLLAGAVLHDIGKIYELSYDRSFGYTTEGQLLGHMVIGLRIVGDKLRGLPDFPPRLRTLVEHMIVSHHGRLRVWLAQAAAVPRGAAAALSRRHGFQDGVHARAGRAGPPGRRAFHLVQRFRSSARY